MRGAQPTSPRLKGKEGKEGAEINGSAGAGLTLSTDMDIHKEREGKVGWAICLRPRYEKPGTHIAYGATSRRD